jgi:hypothetical protein
METNPQTPMIYWSALDWPQPRGIYIYIIVRKSVAVRRGLL